MEYDGRRVNDGRTTAEEWTLYFAVYTPVCPNVTVDLWHVRSTAMLLHHDPLISSIIILIMLIIFWATLENGSTVASIIEGMKRAGLDEVKIKFIENLYQVHWKFVFRCLSSSVS